MSSFAILLSSFIPKILYLNISVIDAMQGHLPLPQSVCCYCITVLRFCLAFLKGKPINDLTQENLSLIHSLNFNMQLLYKGNSKGWSIYDSVRLEVPVREDTYPEPPAL